MVTSFLSVQEKNGMKERLKVEHLSVSFFTDEGEVQAVRDVSFSLNAGEVLAVVGESGCGKSVLCKSIMKLLPENAKIKNGKILVNGEEIAGYGERRMRELRGKLFSMVFQNPMTSLNPTMTVGAQIAEAVRAHQKDMGKEEVEQRVTELMQLVGIEQAEERKKAYPYHFSGGMRQRIVLAIALAGNPEILFADEPTTALDVTIQAQILDLLREIQKKPQRGTVAVFCGPDTRQRLLPLLPFGPDGVGSAAAVRLGKTLTRKEGRLSMAELAFRLRGTVAQQGRGVAHDGFHLRILEAGKALQAQAFFHRVVQRPICAKENTFSRKSPKELLGKQRRSKGRCA